MSGSYDLKQKFRTYALTVSFSAKTDTGCPSQPRLQCVAKRTIAIDVNEDVVLASKSQVSPFNEWDATLHSRLSLAELSVWETVSIQ